MIIELTRNTNTLAVQKIPIVFVPGVMGTRLELPRGILLGRRWDPDNPAAILKWPLLTADDERIVLEAARPANIIHNPLPANFTNTAVAVTPAQAARNWGEVVSSFYVPFLQFMAAQTFGLFQTPVYALGYDWRKSNRDSGTTIASRINGILASENDAQKFILISHSMGGLVTRSMLQNDAGLSGKLLGVIHVMQPTVGAAVFYRRIYTGAISPQDGSGVGGAVLNRILGTTGDSFATIVSGLRGPTELMPTPDYTEDGTAGQWMHFFFGNPPVSVAVGGKAVGFQPYREPNHPPGLGAPSTFSSVNIATELQHRVNEAEAFHTALGLFKHPNTWAIYSTGLETDVAFHMRQDRSIDLVTGRPQKGDGTVPESSARALFPTETGHTLADLCNGDPRLFKVNNVAHAAGMGDAAVQELVKAIVEKILGLRCLPPAPTSPASSDAGGIKTYEETSDRAIARSDEPASEGADEDSEA